MAVQVIGTSMGNKTNYLSKNKKTNSEFYPDIVFIVNLATKINYHGVQNRNQIVL